MKENNLNLVFTEETEEIAFRVEGVSRRSRPDRVQHLLKIVELLYFRNNQLPIVQRSPTKGEFN